MKTPKITLCTLDRTPVCSLSDRSGYCAMHIKEDLSINEITTLSFQYPIVSGGKWTNLQNEQLILFNNEYYKIKNLSINHDEDGNLYVDVSCKHYSDNLANAMISLDEQTPLNVIDLMKVALCYDENGVSEFGWSIGEVTVDGVMKRGLEAVEQSPFSVLLTIAEKFDGILKFNSQTMTIDMLKRQETEHPTFDLRVSKNLKNFNIEYDTSEMYTRLYCYGATDDNGNELDITSVSPDGKPYIENFDYFKTIGYTEEFINENKSLFLSTNIWSDDVFVDAQDLYDEGLNQLAKVAQPTINVSVSALDMGVKNNDITKFDLGACVRVYDMDLGADVLCNVTKRSIDYDNPHILNCDVTSSITYHDTLSKLFTNVNTVSKITTSGGNLVGGQGTTMDNVKDYLNLYYLNVEQLEADYVKTSTLETYYLTAEQIRTNYLDADSIGAKYATIASLNAVEAKIENLDVDAINAKFADIDSVLADYADVHKLIATDAEIEELKAGNITVAGKLKADKAELENLIASKVTAGDFEAYKATIENMFALYATIEELETNYLKASQAELTYAKITELDALTASFNTLNADFATLQTLVANKASIDDLNAANANIKTLKTDLANVNTLLADKVDADYVKAQITESTKVITDDLTAIHAVVDVLDTKYATIEQLNAAKANLETLIAKKATIEDLNAANANISNLDALVANINTILSGSIGTGTLQTIHLTANNVVIDDAVIKNANIENVDVSKLNAGTISTDKFVIQSDDGGILISGSTQQFKDKNGKVRLQIGKDAQGNFNFIVFGEDGTTAIYNQNGITKNAVPDGLIVDKMVADDAAIQAKKVQYTDKDGNKTLQTVIETEQGRIDTLIKETTIDNGDGTTTSLKDAYNETKQTVEGNKTTIANVQTSVNTLTGDVESIKSNITEIEQTADGLKTTVSQASSDASNALSVANSANSTANTASSNASSALTKATALETQAANGEFDGRGVSSTKVEYKASTSGTNAPTGTWSTSVPTVANGSYLWTRTTITYTDNTSSVSYSVARMGSDGAKGDTGETGATGADGKGISSITNYYLATSASSGVTTSTSGWQTSPQTVTSTNKYHWSYQKISYTTGNPTTTTPAIIGVYGDTGSQGAAGKGIKSVKPQYYLSTSSTAQSGGSWKDTQDTWSSGKYYWTRDYITWSDDTTSTTTPILATGLNNANSTANTAKSTADTAKSTADAANTTATNAQTIAQQTASKFSWIVKSGTSETNFTLTDRTASLVADYINLNGKVTFSGLDSSAQSKINTAQSTADTANSKIDNLEIGGRNLIISNNAVDGYVNSTGSVSGSDGHKATDYIPVTPGDILIFQLWSPIVARVWIDDTYFDSDKNYVTGYNGSWYNAKMHYVIKVIVPNNAAYVRFSYTWNNNFKYKLEKGNKATDWTPAPEDKADQSILDAWNSDTVKSDITTINGGYIRTNSITTNQLDTNEIYGNSAFIGAIQATQLNADMITVGTIKSSLLNLYGFKMLNKVTNQESLSITDTGSITMRGSIESYNYHSGKTGWAINSTTDDAEFNNVTVRGSVITNDGGIVSAGGSGRNLQLNTSFYNGLSNWVRGDNYSVDTGFQYKLTNTVKFTRSGLTADNIQWFYSGSNNIRCTVGKSYTAQANFYTKDSSAIDGSGVIFGIYFYDSNNNSAGTSRQRVSFVNNQWVHETITAVAPENAVYVAIVIGAYRNGTFWMAQPKLEEGNVATEWSLAPEDKIKQVRFWAGTSYDERESAPFIVYNDGSIEATQGNFSGVFSGTVDIGNIKITDPSATAGGDALLTIQNGNNGIKRVQLRDTDSSAFAQNLIVSDNAYNTMIELGQNGYGTFKGGINVNNKIYLEGSHLTINGNELTTNSYGFLLNSPQVDVGTVNNTSVLNVYGQSNVNGELKVTKLINYNDTVVATIIAGSSGGIDWDFVV